MIDRRFSALPVGRLSPATGPTPRPIAAFPPISEEKAGLLGVDGLPLVSSPDKAIDGDPDSLTSLGERRSKRPSSKTALQPGEGDGSGEEMFRLANSSLFRRSSDLAAARSRASGTGDKAIGLSFCGGCSASQGIGDEMCGEDDGNRLAGDWDLLGTVFGDRAFGEDSEYAPKADTTSAESSLGIADGDDANGGRGFELAVFESARDLAFSLSSFLIFALCLASA